MNSNIERTNKLKVYRFPSQDNYHCQQCRHELPFKNRKDIDFNYCPYCGESLFGKEKQMNMNTIVQELYKKIKLMDRKSFDNFLNRLEEIYKRTHRNGE